MGKTRVAVIGAGAAGLCSARYMSAEPDVFEITVYEKADRVGGDVGLYRGDWDRQIWAPDPLQHVPITQVSTL